MATRMLQRRGTAEQWTTANPVLGAGEIGFETDTGKFKVGDNINFWDDLAYFVNSDDLAGELGDYATEQYVTSAISDLLGGAPELLDTLDELSAAIGDDANYATTITNALAGKANIIVKTSQEWEADSSIIPAGTIAYNSSIKELKVGSGIMEYSELSEIPTVAELQARIDSATYFLDSVAAEAVTLEINTAKEDILDSSTFTGTMVLPSTTTIGEVSAEEIAYLDGVTSSIQAQIDSKASTDAVATTYAPLNAPTFTGEVVLPNTTSIGTVDSAEIGHLSGVSSNLQDQLDDKAPIADPTFTGTVSGVTSSMVGLGNVDNTADTDKPVSSAQQTALDAKLNLAGGTMTGKITLDGDPTQALHAVTKQYVDSVEAGLITRPAVRAATTANLSGTYDNGTAGVDATLNLGQLATLDIDGVTSWSQWNGILVKNQTNAFENGRYVISQIGNETDTDWILKRCPLCDEADEIPGSYIFVTGGTTNEQTGWVQHVTDPATFTVGTDPIFVYQFAGAGSVTAGTNVSVDGNQVSVVDSPVFSGTVDASAAGVEFSDGTQTQVGVPSITSFSQKTASYQLDTLAHKDNVVEMNMSTAGTFTVPLDATLAWPVGASMDIFATGTGQITIAGEAGVTLNSTPGLKLRTQWSSATIMKRAANNWVVYGDLKA
jgi:hypothetical protein